MDVVRHLTLLTLRYNFYLKVQLIEGKRNDIADLLSRFQMERFRMLAPHADPAPCQVPQALWEIYKQISAITFNCPLQPQLNKLTPLLKNGSWISAPSIAHSLEIAFQRKKIPLPSTLLTWLSPLIHQSTAVSPPFATSTFFMVLQSILIPFYA